MSKITKGDPIPPIHLPSDISGNIEIGPANDKPVVLFCYPKDDTSGCTRESIEFTEKMDEFNKLGVVVYGLSPDPVKKHLKFREKHSLGMALLADEEKTVLEQLGIWVEKSMYGRKYMGVDRSTYIIGTDGSVLEAWNKVKVPGHVDEVLAKAKELFG